MLLRFRGSSDLLFPVACLFHAEPGQWRVEPALPAALEVPLGLAVADDQEVLHGWSVNQSDPAGLPPSGGGGQT